MSISSQAPEPVVILRMQLTRSIEVEVHAQGATDALDTLSKAVHELQAQLPEVFRAALSVEDQIPDALFEQIAGAGPPAHSSDGGEVAG